MRKKNKDIEVIANEITEVVDGVEKSGIALTIAKKNIGKCYTVGKNVEVYLPDGHVQRVKTQEEGMDLLIRNWNLHE